jgi:hypothetical protein
MSTSSIETLPAPVLQAPPEDKFHKELQAFHRLLGELLQTHRGQYVAIHEGQVVDSGPDKLDVADRVYERFGYIPILVTLVADRPLKPIRIPSPRLIRDGNPSSGITP